MGTLIGVPNFLFGLGRAKKIAQTHPFLIILLAQQVLIPQLVLWFSELYGSGIFAYSIDNVLWLLFLFILNKAINKKIGFALLAILIQEFIHVFWYPDSTGILIYFQLSLIAILIAGMNIYKLGIEARDKVITRNSFFLINTGVIFYFALSLVSNLFFDILLDAPLSYFLVIVAVQILAALTLHIFLFLSIWRIPWK